MTERLTEIQDIVRAAKEEGTDLSKVGGHSMIIAAEDAMNRMGVDPDGMLPSKAAFENPETSKRATEVALEGIRDVVGKATSAITDSISKVKERVTGSIRELFQSLKRLDERAGKVSKKIEESEFDAGKAVDESLAKRVSSEAGDVFKSMSNYRKQLTMAESFLGSVASNYGNDIHPIMASAAAGDVPNRKFTYPAPPTGMKKVAPSVLPSPHSKLSSDDFDFYVSDKSSGGYFVYGIFPKTKEEDEVVKLFSGKQSSVFGLHFGNNGNTANAKTLTKDQAARLVDDVQSLVRFMKDEFERAKGYNFGQKIAARVNSLNMKQGPTSYSKRGSKTYNLYIACLHYIANFSSMMWYPSKIRSKAIDSANAALDLIEASIKK